MVYQIAWNDGTIDTFDFNCYSLQEIRNLRDEITLSTRGAYTGQINLVEEDLI